MIVEVLDTDDPTSQSVRLSFRWNDVQTLVLDVSLTDAVILHARLGEKINERAETNRRAVEQREEIRRAVRTRGGDTP